jgi:hypothetical protein
MAACARASTFSVCGSSPSWVLEITLLALFRASSGINRLDRAERHAALF